MLRLVALVLGTTVSATALAHPGHTTRTNFVRAIGAAVGIAGCWLVFSV